MPAGAGHLKGPFHVFLAFHLAEVVGKLSLGLGKLGARVDGGGLQLGLPVEEGDDLLQRVETIHVEVVDDGRLHGIVARQDEAIEMQLARQYGHGQGALDGAQRAVEPEFAHDHVAVEQLGRHLLVAGQDAYGDGQVVGRALLLDVGRRHVDDHIFAREVKARLDDGAARALAALFHGGVGQAHDGEAAAPLDRDFDCHCYGVDALHGGAQGLA